MDRRLLANNLHDARMRVPQRIHADAGNEIKVAAALQVNDENALAAGDGQGIAVVNGDQVAELEVGDVLESHGICN